jgi:hypothetical protein
MQKSTSSIGRLRRIVFSVSKKFTAFILVASFFMAPMDAVLAGERFYPSPAESEAEDDTPSQPSMTSVVAEENWLKEQQESGEGGGGGEI